MTDQDYQPKCSICIDAPAQFFHTHFRIFGSTWPVGFCSKQCQDKAPDTNLCNERVHQCSQWDQLYRAGHLFKEIFYTSRKKTFETLYDPLTARNLDGRQFQIHESLNKDSRFCMREFVPIDGLDKSQNDALLTFNSCWMPLPMFKSIIETLLGDVAVKIKAANVNFRPVHKRVIIHSHDETGKSRLRNPTQRLAHWVILVEHHNGNTYVLDVTGAQFNQRTAVMPWYDFHRSYVCAHGKVLIEPDYDAKPFEGAYVHQAQYKVAEAVCKRFEEDKDRVMDAIKGCTGEEFERFVGEEVRSLGDFLDNLVVSYGGYAEMLKRMNSS